MNILSTILLSCLAVVLTYIAGLTAGIFAAKMTVNGQEGEVATRKNTFSYLIAASLVLMAVSILYLADYLNFDFFNTTAPPIDSTGGYVNSE